MPDLAGDVIFIGGSLRTSFSFKRGEPFVNRSIVALVSFALVTSGCGAALGKAVAKAMGRSAGKAIAKGAAKGAAGVAAGKASGRAATKTASKAGSRNSGKSASNVLWKVAETASGEVVQRSLDFTPSTDSRSRYVPRTVAIPKYTPPPVPHYEPPTRAWVPPPYQAPTYRPPQQYYYPPTQVYPPR